MRRLEDGKAWRWQSSLALNKAIEGLEGHEGPLDAPIVALASGLELQRPSSVPIRSPQVSSCFSEADRDRACRAYVGQRLSVVPLPHDDARVWLIPKAPDGTFAYEARPAAAEGPWSSHASGSWAWTDAAMGPFPAARGKVALEIRYGTPVVAGGGFFEVWRTRVTLDAPGVQVPVGVPDQPLAQALERSMLAGFSLGRFYDGQPLLWLKPENAAAAAALASLDGVLGLRLEVLHDGARTAQGFVWWRSLPSSSPAPYPGGELLVLTPDPGVPPGLSEEGIWTLRLIGDDQIAARAGAVKRYWQGQVEIPLHVSTGLAPWVAVEDWQTHRSAN
jgi:hypothetical protein